MGVELELYVLLVLLTLGSSVFSVFEVETPWWRKALKWFIVIAATVGLYQAAGHLAVLVPILAGGAGSIVHFAWCRRNGIHPLHATPRRRYYELRQCGSGHGRRSEAGARGA